MIVPFQAHGYAGSIEVAYETEGDPEVIGFDLVARGYDDPERFRGFPTMRVSVAYEGVLLADGRDEFGVSGLACDASLGTGPTRQAPSRSAPSRSTWTGRTRS
jgi:hypothetical protein